MREEARILGPAWGIAGREERGLVRLAGSEDRALAAGLPRGPSQAGGAGSGSVWEVVAIGTGLPSQKARRGLLVEVDPGTAGQFEQCNGCAAINIHLGWDCSHIGLFPLLSI